MFSDDTLLGENDGISKRAGIPRDALPTADKQLRLRNLRYGVSREHLFGGKNLTNPNTHNENKLYLKLIMSCVMECSIFSGTRWISLTSPSIRCRHAESGWLASMTSSN